MIIVSVNYSIYENRLDKVDTSDLGLTGHVFFNDKVIYSGGGNYKLYAC